MSERGRALFDRYVATHLAGPLSDALSVQSHAHTLRAHCREAGIAVEEVVEEVGDLLAALITARRKP